jgi:glutamate:GABA antiporter
LRGKTLDTWRIFPLMPAEVSNAPRRAMGFRDLVLFYVVTGISLRWIATAAALGASGIVVWLIAWCAFYLPLALSVVELSSRYPQEGGMYVWSKRAFGEFAGFITGWTYWSSNLPYFPAVLYFAAGNALFVGPDRWQNLSDSKLYFLLFSILGLALATFLNVVGLSVGKWLHNLGAIGTWLPIAILYVIAGVAWFRFGSATSLTARTMMPSLHLRDVLFWATMIFALGGSESASFLGDEVQNPRRSIPRALLIGGSIVTTTYILGTVCVLIALPQGEVSGLGGIMQAISKSAERIGWIAIGPLAALLITLSNLGALGAWLAASARIPFVAGMDRYIPAVFGRVHPRWGTPHVAILTQAACGAAFILLGQAGTSVNGAYEVLVSMGIISYFIPYLFTFAAMIRLQREPVGEEVRRVPGGRPVATLLGLIGFTTTLLTIIASSIPAADEPHRILAVVKVIGLMALLVIVGVLVYFVGRARFLPKQEVIS